MNRLLFRVVSTASLLAVSMSLSTHTASAQAQPYHFTNNCGQAVQLAVNFMSRSGEWTTEGWWQFAPGSSSYLAVGGSRINSTNTIWYYYAESTDGSQLRWGGEDLAVGYGGRTLHMRMLQDSDGAYEWALPCGDHHMAPNADTSFPLTSGSGDYVGAGGANTDATLYYDGTLILESEVWSDSDWAGVYAYVFAVIVDSQGRAIFVSERYDLPTACSKLDPSCATHHRGVIHRQQIPAVVAEYGWSIDLYHGDREKPDFWGQWVGNIQRGIDTYNDLPPEVRTAIALYLGG